MLCFEQSGAAVAIVARSVCEILRDGGVGEVLMVNSSGIYFDVGGQIILLCDKAWGCVPIGIAVEDLAKRLEKLKITQGESFEFCENSLIFSGRRLNLEVTAAREITITPDRPQPPLLRRAAEDLVDSRKLRGISMLVLPLLLQDEKCDVASINPYCARALPLLVGLAEAMTSCSERKIRECVDSLLGLGTGLTPSADDVMLGMLYAFRKLGCDAPPSAAVLRAGIDEMCESHTVRVSAAYLKAVLADAYFERIEQVWDGLCGLQPLDTSALLEVGSSSGSEMLLGILLALHVSGYDININK